MRLPRFLTLEFCVAFSIVILTAGLAVWVACVGIQNDRNPCIYYRPPVGGDMRTCGTGLLGGGYQCYFLYYDGKRKVGGESCTASVRVTESEYSAWHFSQKKVDTPE